MKSLKFSTEIHRSSYNAEMKKSGKTNRFKPMDMSWENEFPDYATLFKRAGWFTFFEIIIVFNP